MPFKSPEKKRAKKHSTFCLCNYWTDLIQCNLFALKVNSLRLVPHKQVSLDKFSDNFNLVVYVNKYAVNVFKPWNNGFGTRRIVEEKLDKFCLLMRL